MLKKYLSNIRANSDRNSTARTSQEASEDSPIDGLSEHDNLMDLKDVFSDVDVPPRSGAYNPDDEGENDEAHSTEDQLDSEIDAFLNEIISEIDETSTPVGHSSDDRPSKMSQYIDALDAIDVFDDIPAPEPISDPFMYERLKEALRERDKLQEKIERLERQVTAKSVMIQEHSDTIRDLKYRRDRDTIESATRFALYGGHVAFRHGRQVEERFRSIIRRIEEVQNHLKCIDGEDKADIYGVLDLIEDILWPETTKLADNDTKKDLLPFKVRVMEQSARLGSLRDIVQTALRQIRDAENAGKVIGWFEKNGGYAAAMAQNTQMRKLLIEVMEQAESLDATPCERSMCDYLRRKRLPVTLREVGKMTSVDVLAVPGIGPFRFKSIIEQIERTGILTILTLNERIVHSCTSDTEVASIPADILSHKAFRNDGYNCGSGKRPEDTLRAACAILLEEIDFSGVSRISREKRTADPFKNMKW